MVILKFFAKFRIGFMVILDKSTYRIVIKLLKQTDNRFCTPNIDQDICFRKKHNYNKVI